MADQLSQEDKDKIEAYLAGFIRLIGKVLAEENKSFSRREIEELAHDKEVPSAYSQFLKNPPPEGLVFGKQRRLRHFILICQLCKSSDTKIQTNPNGSAVQIVCQSCKTVEGLMV